MRERRLAMAACLWLLMAAAAALARADTNFVWPMELRPRTNWTNLSQEQRQQRMKDWEKRRDEFNKLSPEEREAKRKEIKARLEKRLGELRAKQTNGTITTEETRELSRREQILKRFNQPPPPRQGEPAGQPSR